MNLIILELKNYTADEKKENRESVILSSNTYAKLSLRKKKNKKNT